MFCYQCEQTSKGQGCQVLGVCGKDENSATLQDLLIHALKGVSQYAHRAAQLGARSPEIDAFTLEAIFATLTNVNFDADSLAELIYKAAAVRDSARNLYQAAAAKAGQPVETLAGPALFQPAKIAEVLLAQGRQQLISISFSNDAKELKNLEELVVYGLKGVAAYAYHAMMLGSQRPGQLRYHPRASERDH